MPVYIQADTSIYLFVIQNIKIVSMSEEIEKETPELSQSFYWNFSLFMGIFPLNAHKTCSVIILIFVQVSLEMPYYYYLFLDQNKLFYVILI